MLALGVIAFLGSLDLPYFSNTDSGHHLPTSYFVVAVGSVLTFWHKVLMQSTGWLNYCLNWECGCFACFDAISLGCLTALAARRWTNHGGLDRSVRIGSCVGFTAVYLWGIDGYQIFGLSLIALCTALYVLAAVNDREAGFATGRLLRPLRWMGRHSYDL